MTKKTDKQCEQEIAHDIALASEAPNTYDSNSQLVLMTTPEILDLEDGENLWIVKDLIPAGCTFLAATPKSYKTYLSLHIADCLANGKPVFDRFEVEEPKNVMILDRENSVYLIRDRLKQLGIERTPPMLWSFDVTQTGDSQWQKEFKKFLEENKIDFLIIDSFRRFHSGDENSSTEVAKTFQLISEIKALGVSIMFLHHLRKEPMLGKSPPEEMLRGSSDIVAFPDAIIGVKKIIDGNEWVLKISQLAIRAAEPLSPFTLTINSDKEANTISFDYRASLPSELEKPQACQNRIWEMIEDKGEVSRQEFIDALSSAFGQKLIGKTLGRMFKDDIISRFKGANGQHIYCRKQDTENELFDTAKAVFEKEGGAKP